jgi:hypothetical protein
MFIPESPVDAVNYRSAAAWTAAALTVALSAIAIAGLSQVTADGKPFVVGATVIATAAGLGAARLVANGRSRTGGLMLLVVLVMPTYAAAALNLLPALVGVVLVVDSLRRGGLFGSSGPAQSQGS